MDMNKVILIGDTVTLNSGSKHRYEGKSGEVLQTRKDPSAGDLEHQVEFAKLALTEEEEAAMAYIDVDDGNGGTRKVLNLDNMENENVIWCAAKELVKGA